MRRCRPGPATSPRIPPAIDLDLGDAALTGDAVEDLRARGIAGDGTQQPVAPRTRLGSKPAFMIAKSVKVASRSQQKR